MSENNSHVGAKFHYWDKASPPVQLSITLSVDGNDPQLLVGTAKKLAQEALAQGLFVEYPTSEDEIEPNQSLVEADSVIRRRFTRNDGKAADVLDFYLDGLEHRVNYWYINNDSDIAYLALATGLKIESMVVVEGKATITRNQGRPHANECRLPRRMKIVRDPSIDYQTGQQKEFGNHLQWRFSHFLGAPRKSATSTPQTEAVFARKGIQPVNHDNG
jgi:hypothetical protein